MNNGSTGCQLIKISRLGVIQRRLKPSSLARKARRNASRAKNAGPFKLQQQRPEHPLVAAKVSDRAGVARQTRYGLTRAGLPPAGAHQLFLAHDKIDSGESTPVAVLKRNSITTKQNACAKYHYRTEMNHPTRPRPSGPPDAPYPVIADSKRKRPSEKSAYAPVHIAIVLSAIERVLVAKSNTGST
jgi:hypothetical protein